MAIFKITETYDGRLPVYHVIKKITVCNGYKIQKDEIVKSFDTYGEADEFCNKLIADNSAGDNTTSCGEEDPCN